MVRAREDLPKEMWFGLRCDEAWVGDRECFQHSEECTFPWPGEERGHMVCV